MRSWSVVLLGVVLGCTPASSPPRPAAPALRPSSSPSIPEIETLDELGRFETWYLRTPVVERDDGAIVIAHGASNAWTLEALDGVSLRRRWAVPLASQPAALGTFADGRVVVLREVGVAQKDLEATVFGEDGAQLVTSTFTALVGSPCESPHIFRRLGHELVAQVGCGNGRVGVRIDSALEAVRLTRDADELQVARDPGMHVLFREGSQVATMPEPTTRIGGGYSFIPLGKDVVVTTWQNAPRDGRPRFSAHVRVSRFGARPWSVDLVDGHLTDDPTIVPQIATTRDGAVLVPLGYGRDACATGACLPAVPSMPGTRFPLIGDRLALVELDGDTGAKRRLLALRPSSPWTVSRHGAQVTASANHLFVSSEGRLLVFPRRGERTGAGPASVAAPTPLPRTLAAPATPPSTQALEAAWARV